MVSKGTSKWLWNGISNLFIAKSSFYLCYTPSSPIRACGHVDKQVRTKTPYWIYREFPRGSRIGKSSPVPVGCPTDRYYLGSHFFDPLFWSLNMARKTFAPPEKALACVQTSPLPQKKSIFFRCRLQKYLTTTTTKERESAALALMNIHCIMQIGVSPTIDNFTWKHPWCLLLANILTE